MAKLLLHAEIDDEIQQAFRWYAKQSRPVADRFMSSVRDALDEIAAAPMGATVYDEGHRFYRVKKYPHLVIYRYSASEDAATVVAVSHPSQDQSFWQNR